MKAESKRELLVQAAASRFYRFGLSASSIADVANDAGIPSGNVYYHFRSKDSLASAVQEHWQQRTEEALDAVDAEHGDAASRLLAFLDQSESNAPLYAKSGCPIAALSRDFRNGSPALQPLAGRIFEKQADWLERQFNAFGLARRERSAAAWGILTVIQGGIGLAHATHSDVPLLIAIADARGRVADLLSSHKRASS